VRNLLALGTMLLSFLLSSEGGRSLGAEENHLEESAEAAPLPEGDKPTRRTKTSAGTVKDGKERRRTVVPLELPEEGEGQAAEGGLSLDAALQRLLAANRDLAVKYQDIPKARADILSAGSIENPSVFFDGEGIPYGHYSRQRPGETTYGPTVVQPFDVSGKRQQCLRVARRAEKVLEALYQDALRQEIDKLYSAYIDVVEVRLHRDAIRRALARLSAVVETMQARDERGASAPAEVEEAVLRRNRAEIALRETEAVLLEARRELGRLLALSAEQSDGLLVNDSLRDAAPGPPAASELVQLALHVRPDLAAYQLSVERAREDVRLSQAERVEDILVFYTPYQGTTFPSQNRQSASGWETGGLTVLPVFDRNQGDIARGRANVAQLQIQVRGLQEEIEYEVRRAHADYAGSRQLAGRYERDIVPAARRRREEKYRLFLAGQGRLDTFLAAEQNYEEAAHRYLDALVRHRRDMLRLNVAVGQRIFP
jgi:cobalt-zinc-cadmium efflux system outer membrane protein